MVEGDEADTTIAAARRGDHAAWEALYRRLYPKLRAFLARRIGREDAEEAVNETMTRAIAGIGNYEPGASGFDGWVFGIARHVAADHFRGIARDRRQATLAHRVDGGGPEEHRALDDGLVLDDDHATLRTVFARLSPEDQELLELRVVAGLSADQVADILHRRPGAVRTAQSRALSRLRRLLEAQHVAT
jgi:RNA polymerase sigma-70 factor (ECF subfamily)